LSKRKDAHGLRRLIYEYECYHPAALDDMKAIDCAASDLEYF